MECRVGANSTILCVTTLQAVQQVTGERCLCQRERGPYPSMENPTNTVMGAVPKNGGSQPKDWLSGSLRATFLTQASSSRSWTSSSDVLEFAYCVLEVDGTFLTCETRLLYMSGRRVFGLVRCCHVRNMSSP